MLLCIIVADSQFLFAGSNSGHAAMVTRWTSPQCGQIWHPIVWLDISPNWLKIWHTEYPLPLSSGWKIHVHTEMSIHTHRQIHNTSSGPPYRETVHHCQLMYLHDTRHSPASYWNAYSIFWVQNHADLRTYAQITCSCNAHCSPFGSGFYLPVHLIWDAWYCASQ